MQQRQSLVDHFPSLVIVSGLLAWGCFQVGPLYIGSEPQWLPAALYSVTALMGLRIVIHCLIFIARFFEWASAHKSTGKGGTAKWGTYKDLKGVICNEESGPFHGRTADNKKPLFIDFESNSLTVGPAGSGKGIYSVITNALSIKKSKVINDFKGELSCILKNPLQERNEKVRILNPGKIWHEILGDGDCYNPLDIIAVDLERPGGLLDVPDDLKEINNQLLPEPAESSKDDSYWRDGARKCIGIAMLIECMIEGRDALLMSVALMIDDREALEHNLRWVVGIDLESQHLSDGPMPIEKCTWAHIHDVQELAEFIRWLRGQCKSILDLMKGGESKTFDSFLSAAQLSISAFSFGTLSRSLRRSTFSMSDLKDAKCPTTLLIVIDPSKLETYSKYIGLIQWCVLTEIKRHPDKDCPVYFLMDEAANFKIYDLEGLLTWARGYGARLKIYLQNFTAFEKRYGKTIVETLLSETQIKEFLPGQKSPKTLKIISDILGEQSVMASGFSKSETEYKESTNESARLLLKPDEVRRLKNGIVIVNDLPPILTEPVSYAEIEPWRKQADINPFHKKPFLKKVKIKLRRGGN
jgi:type IV secretion system protein VirD4